MIPTISLANIDHITLVTTSFTVMRTSKIYSWQLSNMEYSIINYSWHAVLYIHRTFSLLRSLYLSLPPCCIF